jgi:hypothetical protein
MSINFFLIIYEKFVTISYRRNCLGWKHNSKENNENKLLNTTTVRFKYFLCLCLLTEISVSHSDADDSILLMSLRKPCIVS